MGLATETRQPGLGRKRLLFRPDWQEQLRRLELHLNSYSFGLAVGGIDGQHVQADSRHSPRLINRHPRSAETCKAQWKRRGSVSEKPGQITTNASTANSAR
jgi:hypothetical protein